MVDYQKMTMANNVQSIEDLYKLFWDVVSSEWTKLYASAFPKHGEITLQNFLGFAFLIDHVWPEVQETDINNELPETRVVSFFGISNTNITKNNRSSMQRGWGKTSEALKDISLPMVLANRLT